MRITNRYTEGLSAAPTSDLAGLALNHHVENLPVLGHLYPTAALGELDQGFIAVKSGSARQRRAHSVSVEEDHVQALPEGHQDLVTYKASRCSQFLHAAYSPCVKV
jgi:hypothetical protein